MRELILLLSIVAFPALGWAADAKPAIPVDPFAPPAAIVQLPTPPPGECAQLCALPTTDWHLRGVVWDVFPPRALLENAAGQGVIARQGDRIGTQNGRVIRVEPRRIVVLEFTGQGPVPAAKTVELALKN